MKFRKSSQHGYAQCIDLRKKCYVYTQQLRYLVPDAGTFRDNQDDDENMMAGEKNDVYHRL